MTCGGGSGGCAGGGRCLDPGSRSSAVQQVAVARIRAWRAQSLALVPPIGGPEQRLAARTARHGRRPPLGLERRGNRITKMIRPKKSHMSLHFSLSRRPPRSWDWVFPLALPPFYVAYLFSPCFGLSSCVFP